RAAVAGADEDARLLLRDGLRHRLEGQLLGSIAARPHRLVHEGPTVVIDDLRVGRRVSLALGRQHTARPAAAACPAAAGGAAGAARLEGVIKIGDRAAAGRAAERGGERGEAHEMTSSHQVTHVVPHKGKEWVVWIVRSLRSL